MVEAADTNERWSMTVKDMLTNPPGKYTRHVGARYREIDALEAIYRKALADPARAPRFSIECWERRPRAEYLVHVKVPSEKNATDFDVLFLLDYETGTTAATGRARVRVFCNSPGWVMTYGYVAFHKGIIVPGWERALGRAATEPPLRSNPGQDYGFDKVVQQAAWYMLGRGGLVTVGDAVRMAEGTRDPVPAPADSGWSASEKMAEYEGNDARVLQQKRLEREEARRAQNREEEERKKADRQRQERQSGAGKTAKGTKAATRVATAPGVKTVKATRPAARAGSKKGRTE